jgi:GDP-L-fucose synthase
MNKTSKIYVAGHMGMVGSAILRKLQKEGYTNLLIRSRNELDLADQKQVELIFRAGET